MHLARRNSTGELVAIKSIDKMKLSTKPQGKESLQREISILLTLKHPGIVKLYEVYENELYIHLIMEYLAGGELFYTLQARVHYTEKEAATAMLCILEALEYCHEKGIIHRDIKPENLILVHPVLASKSMTNKHDKDLTLKIADFGLSVALQPNKEEKQRCGSVGYAAPEVLRGKAYNSKADVFSAGVTLYLLYL